MATSGIHLVSQFILQMIWIILVGRLDAKTMVMYDNILANHPDGLASVIFERLVTQCYGEKSRKKRCERKSITLK